MTSPAAPLALAMGVFVLFCVLAIGLIPVLEGILRQEVAREPERNLG